MVSCRTLVYQRIPIHPNTMRNGHHKHEDLMLEVYGLGIRPRSNSLIPRFWFRPTKAFGRALKCPVTGSNSAPEWFPWFSRSKHEALREKKNRGISALHYPDNDHFPWSSPSPPPPTGRAQVNYLMKTIFPCFSWPGEKLLVGGERG